MIYLTIPSLPPSSNTAYFNNPRGGRMLTKVGRAYLVETKAYLARTYPQQLATLKKEHPYLLHIRFGFETILNKGWPEKAENRYKRLDVGNRLKLLEDALKDAAGIDDSQNLVVVLHKVQTAEPRTQIWLWSLEDERSPFDCALELH